MGQYSEFNDQWARIQETVSATSEAMRVLDLSSLQRMARMAHDSARIVAQVEESLRPTRERIAEIQAANQATSRMLASVAESTRLAEHNLLRVVQPSTFSLSEILRMPLVDYSQFDRQPLLDVFPAINTIFASLSTAQALARSLNRPTTFPWPVVDAETVANLPEGPSPATVGDAPFLAATIVSMVDSILRAVGRVRLSREDWMLVIAALALLLQFLMFLGYGGTQAPPPPTP
jgi:hypothetical protein